METYFQFIQKLTESKNQRKNVMPTGAQIAPILTGILLLGWLFHPVGTPRHSNSKKTT